MGGGKSEDEREKEERANKNSCLLIAVEEQNIALLKELLDSKEMDIDQSDKIRHCI